MNQRKHSSSLSLFIRVLITAFGLSAATALAQPMHDMASMPATSSTAAIDVVRDPAEVPGPIGNRGPAVVKVELTAMEVVGKLDPASGTTYRYWTFNGKVPAPMIRVREGDSVEVTLHNSSTSHMVHSLDFHAAVGPGGGAALSQVTPGQEKTFTFLATTPGLYVYHCGTPMISDHIANGMYGLILVEPAGGLPRVDHEYYVMQGEIYTSAPKGKTGLQTFSEANLMKEAPDYFVFNGAVDALTKEHPMSAEVGQTVRLFFGDAGPNATSSLHVVGEIFTRDYQLGSLQSPPLLGVQTASVPAGGAAILELKTVLPGQFNLMDHAMARMAKGLVATLNVTGQENTELIHSGPVPAEPLQLRVAGLASAAQVISAPIQQTASSSVRSVSSAGESGEPRMKMHREAVDQKMQPTSRRSEPNRSNKGVLRLDGCLTMSGAVATLTLFHSAKSYLMEPEGTLLTDHPLAFADNVNKLVEVLGKRDRNGHLYGADWFMVDSIEQLSPVCNPTQSLARLRSAASASNQSPQATMAALRGTHVVGMVEMAFTPAEITINAGERVVWNNSSFTVHNVVDDAAEALNAADVQLPKGVKPFASGYLQPNQSFQRTFTVPGVYHYVCTLHENGGMKGTIIVKASGTIHMASAGGAAGQ